MNSQLSVDRVASAGLMHTARSVISLFKLRIGFMIMLTALVGMLVVPGSGPGAGDIVLLGLAVLVASASAGAFNQYHEFETDRLMARTRGRAFVTGALVRSPVWLVVMGLMLAGSVGAAAWWLNPVSAVFVFLGAFFYAIVYTVWLKRRSWLNIVVGGMAGSFAVLAGATAVDPVPGAFAWMLAAVLFLWTPPHFWSLAIANHAEYKAAGVPMLPVVVGVKRTAVAVLWSTVALAVVSVLPFWFGAGTIYLLSALAGSGFFVFKAWKLAMNPSRQTAMGSFFASLLQLGLLLAGATIDSMLR